MTAPLARRTHQLIFFTHHRYGHGGVHGQAWTGGVGRRFQTATAASMVDSTWNGATGQDAPQPAHQRSRSRRVAAGAPQKGHGNGATGSTRRQTTYGPSAIN